MPTRRLTLALIGGGLIAAAGAGPSRRDMPGTDLEI